MADTNLTKIDLYETTLSTADMSNINENAQYNIKDMPIGGITNAEMVLALSPSKQGIFRVGAVYMCTDTVLNQYTEKHFYKFTGVAWIDITNEITIDSALDSNSTNPVQNKVVTNALNGKQDTLTAGTNISISSNVISATDTTYSAGTGLTLSGTTFNVNTNVIETKPTEESYTIATTDWTALSSSDPYTYSATVTATYTIGNDTEVGIVADNPVLFANYGFVVGAVNGQNVTIYALEQPSSSVTLSVSYRG